MPQARQYQVSLDATPYYHCISRCVRRAFLCGFDKFTGRSFEHRRGWIVERLKQLTDCFAVDLCAYAVMSNHFHLVVKIQRDQAMSWSADEVIERWTRLFSTPILVRRYQSGENLSGDELDALTSLIADWRERLYSLSWFMRALNEPIARQANQEDGCTGRFWSGRFTSQALLDEAALLTAMAYVDLNPVRAGIAETPDESDFTSIQERIRQWSLEKVNKATQVRANAGEFRRLMSFRSANNEHENNHSIIPFTFKDYLELVDWSGRAVRDDKHGYINSSQPPILERLGIDGMRFLRHMQRKRHGFHHVIGRWQRIQQAGAQFGVCFFKGQAYASQVFSC